MFAIFYEAMGWIIVAGSFAVIAYATTCRAEAKRRPGTRLVAPKRSEGGGR